MKKFQKNKQSIIYQAKSGALELRVDATKETIWASRMQMAEMFGVNPPAISKHIQNIYKEKELFKKSTSSKMELVQNESGRTVKRQIDIYNLDVLIAVGYRVNSLVGTKFRRWATKTLRNYIVDGYAINKNRVAKNYQHFLIAVNDIKRLLPAGSSIDTVSVIELVNMFADTWLSLDAYDKNILKDKGLTKKSVVLTAEKLTNSLEKLKRMLGRKDKITEFFGKERGCGNVAGIVGDVMQTFDGQPLYETVEEKAAHLLYFMVKNHPFVDGNKRNGAYAFIWFLRQAKILDTARLTPPALTALTILVAESDPKEKDKIIRLILTLLV
jgi:hypothetical protein